MFKRRTKFEPNALKTSISFAFLPKYIDGGTHKIWMQFYYNLYERTKGYLNWDIPDEFQYIGSYSKEGLNLKFKKLKKDNPKYHWIHEDNYIPYDLKE